MCKMTAPDHKTGEVLNINIRGIITSCIVIKDLGEHYKRYSDLMIFNQVGASPEDRVYWFPKNQYDLLTKGHWIYKWERDGNAKYCYQLLIGDKKVWLTYGDD